MSSSIPADKEQTDRERRTDQDNINPSDAVRSLSRCIGSFRAFDPFGCHFKCPCDDERYRKTDDEEENYQAHHPVGDFEKWKNLAGNLHQQPRHDRIRDCHFVNVAPLQLCEKIRFVHDFVGLEGTRTLSFWHNAVKRGSSR